MNKYNIKKAYKSYKKIYNGNKYRAVKETIDDIEKLVDGSVIDDSFYEKYCELKKGNFICNTILDPMSISILTGLATGFAIDSFKKWDLWTFLIYIICYCNYHNSFIHKFIFLYKQYITPIYVR